ncbi:MAG: amidohydrolase family protein [Flavobacteriaceae bacterium]|nr:amidohydrolase family protein [Flavobacteriaceae bacterium]
MLKCNLFLGGLLLTVISCQPNERFFKDALCIENITTIDAKNGLLENQTVIIKDGKIHKVSSSKELRLSQKNKVIDGSGKYLVPGLWDTHIHFSYMEELAPSMFDLFLAYGITGVRDTGGQITYVKKFKELSLANPTTTPRVMIAGPLLDGTPNVYDGSPGRPNLSAGLGSLEAVTNEVNILDSLGVDFLKAYEMLTPQQFMKITQLAQEKGLKVTGHVPLSMDVISASNAGLNSMEHLRNLELSCASNAKELLENRKKLLALGKNDAGGILRSRIHSTQRMPAIKNYDEDKAQEVLDVLAKNNTWQIPTLALYRSVRLKENFKYLPDSIRKAWEQGLENIQLRAPAPDRANYADWMSKMIGKIHQNKIEIMAGTDTPIGYLTPGLSLHEELSQLVQSGLSPLEAIKTATLNPAIYFELDSELGWIGESTWADLIVLDKNPLENISNTKEIHAVIKQGNYMNRDALDQMLKTISEN